MKHNGILLINFLIETRYCLVDHHLKSYNKFYENDIFNIFREKNPVKILKIIIRKQVNIQCYMYMGGKSGKNLLWKTCYF